MTAFHTMILSGHGLPEIPPGGSVERRLKSRMRRRLQLVDYSSWLANELRSGWRTRTMTVIVKEKSRERLTNRAKRLSHPYSCRHHNASQ